MKRILLALILVLLANGAGADVVLLPTGEGAARLQRSATPQGLGLFGYVETERRLSFCGPASLAAALNSLGIVEPTPVELHPWRLLTQDTVFTPENQRVKSYFEVEQKGLTLDELGRFAANLRAAAEVVHAADVTPGELHRRMVDALADPAARLLVNYSRVPLGQNGEGHISPVGAYDAATDSFLVLDVARYKYPPAWVSFDLLRAGMLLVDDESTLSRGILILTTVPQAAKQ